MSIDRDLHQIDLQERELQFRHFDFETAWKLGVRIRELAVARGHAIAIDVRRFGQPVFYCALAGSTPDNAEWVRRKSNVVARFHRSSYGLGLSLKRDAATITGKYGVADADYASHGGAFPLSVVSAGVVGSVTVSGLPQRADHELVVEALCGELGRDYALFALASPPE